MSKSDLGAGLGVAVALAVCCGSHLVIAAVAISGMAVLTGQTLAITVAALAVVVAGGALAWRSIAGPCFERSCAQGAKRPVSRSLDVAAAADHGGAAASAHVRGSRCMDRTLDD